MYQDYYQFQEKPFSLTPDPKFLYRSETHQDALDHLLYGIRQREGFMLLTGEVGTGKTTLCRSLLGRLGPEVKSALVLDPLGSEMDLLRALVGDLGVQPAADHALLPDRPREGETAGWVAHASKKELTDALLAFLLEQHRSGGATVFIIDEAQALSYAMLEQLRLLSNMETEKDKLLQILFVGQVELADKLDRPELKQLKERISIRCKIGPLPRRELASYIQHRVLVAGAGERIHFTASGLNEIHKYSGGVPRRINLLCDRALLVSSNAQTGDIDKSHVRQAIRSLEGGASAFRWRSALSLKMPVVATALVLLAALMLVALPGEFASKQQAASSANGVSAARPQAIFPSRAQVVPVSAIDGAVNGASANRYQIQVLALGEAAKADKEVRALAEEGYPAYWKKAFASGRDWYIVYVGPYDKVMPARIHLNALRYSGRHPILLSFTSSD